MINNYRKIAEYTPDDLIASTIPAIQVAGCTIRKEGSAETTYKRGTILVKSSIDAKCVILGTKAADAVEAVEADPENNVEAVEAVPAEVLTPYGILCDDITVGTSEDVSVPVYTAGCFNMNKVVVADEYDITDADIDALRCRNIVFKAAATL